MKPGQGRIDDSWDSPRFRERDTPWAAGCRLLQGWWREHVLHMPPGPSSRSKPGRLAVSMLPFEADPGDQFLTVAAEEAVTDRLAEGQHSGIIASDRLYRNLLSSQPLAFNLFGPFTHDPDGLLGWVATIDAAATEVTGVHFEWAPPKDQHFGGGSAFDVFVTYRARGRIRFLGVECKYAEDLRASGIKVRDTYRHFTDAHQGWRDGAAQRLDQPHLRQFWLNTLLTQSLADNDDYETGTCVVLTSAADSAACDAVDAVRAEVVHPDAWLRWSSYEEVLALITPASADWVDTFRRRYLDFRPVAHLLDDQDPRQPGVAEEHLTHALSFLLAVGGRVLRSGSVIEQIIEAHHEDRLAPGPPPQSDLAARAQHLAEALQDLRADLADLHARIEPPGPRSC